MVDNTIEVVIKGDSKSVVAAIDKLNVAVDKMSKSAGKGLKKTSIAFDVLKANVLTGAIFKGVQLIGRAFGDVAGNALEFSKAVAEINSILPKNQQLTQKTREEFIKFSNSFAGTPQAQAKAFYAIVSAGVKGTAKQLSILATANKAAVAGLVDIDTASKVLVSSVNAYSKSGLTATQASDILFTTVREGQTTFSELSSTIGRVAPIASAAGLKFSELGGALAFITKSGVSTDEAVTGLRAVLTGLIKPSEQAKKYAKDIGLEFNTTALRAKGFAGFMKDVIDKTGGTEVALAKLFPNVRALGPIIQIANGNFEDFKRILGETGDAAGATDAAFQTISKSAAFQFERLTQELKNIPQAFLTNFEEPIADAIKAIREFVSGNGILMVVKAVDTAISVLAGFSQAAANVESFFNFMADAGLATAETFFQIAEGVNSLAIAAARLAGSDSIVASLENQNKALNRNIKTIQDARAANEESNNKIIESEANKQAKITEFRNKLEAGRNEQVAGEDAAREEKISKDKAAADKELQGLKDKLGASKSISALFNEAKASQDEAARAADLERKEVEKEEDYIFLEEQLGEEEALKAIVRARELEELGKHTEAIAVLNGARTKATKVQLKKREKQEAQSLKTLFTLDKKTQENKAANFKSSLNTISSLSSSNNKTLFAIGKASALATGVIDGISATQKALTAAPPPFNFALAALVGTASAVNLAKIASSKPPSFQTGGIVPGASFSGDNVDIRANSGEMILTREQQSGLFENISSGELGESPNVSVNVAGDVVSEDGFIDRVVDGINEGVENRNVQLRTAA